MIAQFYDETTKKPLYNTNKQKPPPQRQSQQPTSHITVKKKAPTKIKTHNPTRPDREQAS